MSFDKHLSYVNLPSVDDVELKQDLSDFPLDEQFVSVKSKGKQSVLQSEAVNRMKRMLSKCYE